MVLASPSLEQVIVEAPVVFGEVWQPAEGEHGVVAATHDVEVRSDQVKMQFYWCDKRIMNEQTPLHTPFPP